MWDLSFLTRDPHHAPCSESTESELLNCQGNLPNNVLNSTLVFELCLHLILKKTGNTVPIWLLLIAEEDLTELLPCCHFQSCFFGLKEVNGSKKKKKMFLWLLRRLSSLIWKWCQFSKILVRLSHTVRNASYSNFVSFLPCHCTFILSDFWVLSLNILLISVKRKIPSPTDVFP